jgi:hypothetical protein
MTLFGDETINSTAIDALICDTLHSENLRLSHPTIQSIECIQSNGDVVTDDNPLEVEKSTPTFEPVSQGLGANGLLVSVAAALVVVLGLYGYRRRHRRNDKTKETGHLDDSDLANMSNSLSYEGGVPALDFTSIVPTFTAQVGIESIARHSYFPVS